MKTMHRAAMLLAGATLAAAALSGCSGTPDAPETSAPPYAMGEDAYLTAAESRLNAELGIKDSFTAHPDLKQVALDIAEETCALVATGVTEADIYATLDSENDAAVKVMRYWIAAATTYVC